MPERIVVVEDDTELRSLLVELLAEVGHETAAYDSGDAALRALRGGQPADLVLTDLIMPGIGGRELLGELRALRPELNVIVITAFGSIESAIELVKAGAYDYLTKPVAAEDLLQAVNRALGESRARRELSRLVEPGAGAAAALIGNSPALRSLLRTVARMAHSRHPVVIAGESGTGKELVARTLHEISGRRTFVPINCGALPENLLESELFGHEKGAFTGADRAKEGLFDVAHGGTLFLDEIGELPLSLQPKLLRALEQGEVWPVEGIESRRLDVRVIAATNGDLEAEVRAGTFREDLYWRLSVLHLRLPPLRDRSADVPLLAEHFLLRAAAEVKGTPGPETVGEDARRVPRRITTEAMALLTAYPWPGNVRELRNAIEQAATLARHEELAAEDLPPRIREAGRPNVLVAEASQRLVRLRDLERSYILDVMQQVGGNKSRAAEILGLDRKTLYRKLEEYRREDVTPGG